ncbi:MAG TPA: Hsp70 family protein, partial [Bryobacteraceae bacterium]
MPQFIIGIDLGTTNCALAYAAVDREAPDLQLFDIAQLVNPGEVANETLLPSSLYIPGAQEFVEGSLALPWNENPPYVIGKLAQKRGVENAGRLVSSAKSWLSSQNADPTKPLLPLSASEGVEKVSPLDAARQYLDHLRLAWNQEHERAKLEAQQVLITVPASFDAAARELTQRAAKLAGYP